jgi:hypothetical protein
MNDTPTPRTDAALRYCKTRNESGREDMAGYSVLGIQKIIVESKNLECELTAAREDARWLESIMVRLYNQGYHAGHEDTVEACFTPIHHTDMDAYHADVVAEILQENAGGMARELAAQDSDNSNDLNG